MNIVIAGAGEVGTHLARMLSNENHDIVVIDPDENNLRILGASLDLISIQGSATSIANLKEANIRKADLLIGVTYSEDTNITAAILGKRLGARNAIARIDNNEYLDNNNREYFIQLGIDYMIFPEQIASREIIDLLHQTGTSDTVEFSGGKLSLYVVKLEEKAPMVNKTLNEFTKKAGKLDYRAVAITRKGSTIIPSGDDVFLPNDIVYAICNPKGVDALMKYSGKEIYEAKNIMILGGSRIGRLTCEGLGYHHNIKLIEMNREKSYWLSNQLKNTLVINGDGRDMDLLQEEKLAKMDAFVAVTGSSETNILSCLHAKEKGVRRTIAEVENFNYLELAENLGIDTIINKKISAASRIFRFTTSGGQISSIKCLRGTEAEVMEFVVQPGSLVTQGKLKDVKFPADAIIGGVVRGDNSFIATGDTEIRANDSVVVFAMPSIIQEIGKFFSE